MTKWRLPPAFSERPRYGGEVVESGYDWRREADTLLVGGMVGSAIVGTTTLIMHARDEDDLWLAIPACVVAGGLLALVGLPLGRWLETVTDVVKYPNNDTGMRTMHVIWQAGMAGVMGAFLGDSTARQAGDTASAPSALGRHPWQAVFISLVVAAFRAAVL